MNLKFHQTSVFVLMLLLVFTGGCSDRPQEKIQSTQTPTRTSIPTLPPPTSTAAPASGSEQTQFSPTVEEIAASLEGLDIDAFFEESYKQLLLRDPDHMALNRLDTFDQAAANQFSNLSVEYLQETAQLEAAILDMLYRYDREELTSAQKLSYDIYAWILEDRVQGQAFMFYDFPVNPLTIWGKQNWIVDFLVNYQPVDSIESAEAYLQRLSKVGGWTEQLIEGLSYRAAQGIVPPRYILEQSIDKIETHIGMQSNRQCVPEATELFNSFSTKVNQLEGVSQDKKQDLIAQAREQVKEVFIPAFLELRDVLDQILDVAGEEGGAWNLPNGEAYYAYALQHHATLQISPDEVYQMGLDELARVQAEINALASELGYTVDELDTLLEDSSELIGGDNLLAEFNRLIGIADQKSREVFNLYPASELVIKPEPYGSLAYYLPPAYDLSTPGQFFVNLSRPMPRYLLPAFIFHETIPGHHLQGALTRELNIPLFQKDVEFSAYVEGWALYAERLAWEMGLYGDDPVYNYGRLRFEEMRALRLIVDTGVNSKGWTFEETSAKVEELTGSSISRDYLTRFYVLPGQASSYTIGMLKILELRQLAMDQLGDEFDLAEFHDVILGSGPVPLSILQRMVESWINEKL